jgi:hypothetical protein
MRRAWKPALIVALTLASRSAFAFHAGSTFDKPPGAGGGGGIFYTGSPIEKGWDCRACHVNAEGRIKVRLQVDPPALFEKFRYVPSQTYKLTATLEGEHLGLTSPRANFNGLAVALANPKGEPVGSLSGPPDLFISGGPATITSAGQKTAITTWTFDWQSPPPGTGAARIHLAAVDGNGAESGPTGTLTDAFGDDVFVATVELEEEGRMGLAPAVPAEPSDPGLVRWSAIALVATAVATRRKLQRGRDSKPV